LTQLLEAELAIAIDHGVPLAKPLGAFQGQAGNRTKLFVGSHAGHQCILPPKAGTDQGSPSPPTETGLDRVAVGVEVIGDDDLVLFEALVLLVVNTDDLLVDVLVVLAERR
jgi:hypothetical protein